MLGWLSILKKGVAAGRNVDRAVETVERNIQLQARLVDDLLDVSRIVSSKLVIDEAPVDPAPCWSRPPWRAPAPPPRPSVMLACSVASPPGPVMGDEKRLRQMVGNLVGNALKFTPRGGRVSVALAVDDATATLTVGDTGAGIAAELLAHVFERFWLADASSTRDHGGLGLGLTIVKTLAELHGGRVGASSEGSGRGATFTLHLPLRPASVDLAPTSSEVGLAPNELSGVTVHGPRGRHRRPRGPPPGARAERRRGARLQLGRTKRAARWRRDRPT